MTAVIRFRDSRGNPAVVRFRVYPLPPGLGRLTRRQGREWFERTIAEFIAHATGRGCSEFERTRERYHPRGVNTVQVD